MPIVDGLAGTYGVWLEEFLAYLIVEVKDGLVEDRFYGVFSYNKIIAQEKAPSPLRILPHCIKMSQTVSPIP